MTKNRLSFLIIVYVLFSILNSLLVLMGRIKFENIHYTYMAF